MLRVEVFFFFQAEDGIRDYKVTGVQTCALPISQTLTQRSHADYNGETDLKAMIRTNLIAERVAIEAYSQMIDLIGDKDPTTRRLIESILEQEQEHADELSDWLEK